MTDRWNGNTATITYDVYDWHGDKVGELDLHLSVPGSRWNSETRTCDARGAVVCNAYGDVFSVYSGPHREGCPSETPGRSKRPVAKPAPPVSPSPDLADGDRGLVVATLARLFRRAARS